MCHVITGLEVGGAEMMLYRLLTGLDSDRFASEVISLTDVGPVGQLLRGRGVSVSALHMRPRLPDALRAAMAPSYVRRSRPDIVQT